MASSTKIWNSAFSSHCTEGSLSQSQGTSYSDSSNGDSAQGSQAQRPPAASKGKRRETAQVMAALNMVEAKPLKAGKRINKLRFVFDSAHEVEVGAYVNDSKVDRPVVPDPKELSGTREKKQLISL
eukprot:TRINITY_DN47713_c0_g1_i1.p2 TRINITY_DN47713_c0_g1~~TRINITY_DN47713_c0_g1_i1.p2  ORF type:complete len:126 (+),score=17.94 TRINITY_DN47713_c0_g1_i1:194-571(+)